MNVLPSASPPDYSAQRTNAASSTLQGALRVQAMANGADVTTANPLPVSSTVTPSGGSKLTTSQVSVGVTPTLLVAAENTRVSITVNNTGTTVVFLGGAAVSTTTGLPLAGTVGATQSFNFTGALYGIVATGTEIVAVADLLQ